MLASDDEDSFVIELPTTKKKTLSSTLSGGNAITKKKKLDNRPVEEIYQKKTQLEHILLRPDTYIGSTEMIKQPIWIYNAQEDRMVFNNNLTFPPGLFKIFDEILVNAADNKTRDPEGMDTIKVDIDTTNQIISIYNNGKGIPIERHAKEGIYVPELIFGHLLTSSNYNDEERKITGGRNGYGAKLCNIFSREFIIETADSTNGKSYKQVWHNNMSKVGTPLIKAYSKEDFTKVTFKPDLEKFGMSEFDNDLISLFQKRVYDVAGCLKNVKVFLNGQRIKIKNFKQYVEMYFKQQSITNSTSNNNFSNSNSASQTPSQEEGAEGGEGTFSHSLPIPHSQSQSQSTLPSGATLSSNSISASNSSPNFVHQIFSDRWEICCTASDGQFQQVSFVNNINTYKGGTHVQYITDQITSGLVELVKKKHKDAKDVKPHQIKNHLFIFINCLIENPSFDSQTKENMTLKHSSFGSKCEIDDGFIGKIAKSSGILENIINFIKFKQNQSLKKTDGHKTNRLSGIPKLDDANNAGTKNASRCTLILTEGDSAKALAVSGLGVIGRDDYGVFPLRGKLLNVRDATHKQIMENAEINNVKQILGLQHGKAYSSIESLRYGHLMIMTDQDHDGSHIKGLLINFIDHFWPSLLRVPGFLVEFITPIVKVTKRKGTSGNSIEDGENNHNRNEEVIAFYTIPEYEEWKRRNNQGRGWHIKYYKGLGTSTATDAKKYFQSMNIHRKKFSTATDQDRQLVDMAFNKKKADERKDWLKQYNSDIFIDNSQPEITITEFINKELILFSMADNVRSIPSMIDGLKPGHRKILFSCFKRKLKGEIKVMQLAGYVSEHAAYHHGEQSLCSTIVGLAQNFVGSNNINLLEPIGQFGTRLQGGKDAASSRYIFTSLSPFTRLIYRSEDDPLLNYLNDDGQQIEPEWYIPILPMVLVNGSEGIGTGWSTAIPNYNPLDLVTNLKLLMNGRPESELMEMHPWYLGFNGKIEYLGNERYKVTGNYQLSNDMMTLEITELPIGTWTQTYKEFLESILQSDNPFIKYYREYHTDTMVKFIIQLTSPIEDRREFAGSNGVSKDFEDALEKKFKLATIISTSNLVCFSPSGHLKKYSSPLEILQDFHSIRLEFYQKRKERLIVDLEREWLKANSRIKFIKEIISGKLIVQNRKKMEIIKDLKERGYKSINVTSENSSFKDGEKEETEELEETISPEEMKQNKMEKEGKFSDQTKSNISSINDKNDNFDYLLSMPIYNLTREMIEKLEQECKIKEDELNSLLEKSSKDLWLKDLNTLEEEWIKRIERTNQQFKSSSSTIKATGMKITGNNNDSSKGKRKYSPKKPLASSSSSTSSKKGTVKSFSSTDSIVSLKENQQIDNKIQKKSSIPKMANSNTGTIDKFLKSSNGNDINSSLLMTDKDFNSLPLTERINRMLNSKERQFNNPPMNETSKPRQISSLLNIEINNKDDKEASIIESRPKSTRATNKRIIIDSSDDSDQEDGNEEVYIED